MDNPKFFLKKRCSGITLVELLIAMGILILLALFAIGGLKPQIQVFKALDSKRKSDLKKIQVALEDYYEDHNSYPESLIDGNPLADYMSPVPQGPRGNDYSYYSEETDSPQYYRIYTNLDYECDTDIYRVGCGNGCGPGGTSEYNYGISSTNVSLESGSGSPLCSFPTTPVIEDCAWACSGLNQCDYVCFPAWPDPGTCPQYDREDCRDQCDKPSNICDAI